MVERLVEEIAYRGAKWPSEHERDPKQDGTRNVRPEIRRDSGREAGGKNQRASGITEPRRIGHPVAERGAQGLRKQDRDPIEDLGLLRIDRIGRNRSQRTKQGQQRSEVSAQISMSSWLSRFDDRLHDLIFPGRRCGRKSTATAQKSGC